ncbi:MAG: hypothetical protein ACK41F_10085 [Fimbriimonadaceae bacterium]
MVAWREQARRADAIPCRVAQRLSLRTWSGHEALGQTGSAEVITDGTRYRITCQLGERGAKETYTFDGRVWMTLLEDRARSGAVFRRGSVSRDPVKDIGTRLEDHLRHRSEGCFYVRLSDLLTVSHVFKRPMPEVMRRPGLRYAAHHGGDDVVLKLEKAPADRKELFVSRAVLSLQGESIALVRADCVHPGAGVSGGDLMMTLEPGGIRPSRAP